MKKSRSLRHKFFYSGPRHVTRALKTAEEELAQFRFAMKHADKIDEDALKLIQPFDDSEARTRERIAKFRREHQLARQRRAA